MVIQKPSTSASTTARIVWDTADKYLRNVVEPQEYGDYILQHVPVQPGAYRVGG